MFSGVSSMEVNGLEYSSKTLGKPYYKVRAAQKAAHLEIEPKLSALVELWERLSRAGRAELVRIATLLVDDHAD